MDYFHGSQQKTGKSGAPRRLKARRTTAMRDIPVTAYSDTAIKLAEAKRERRRERRLWRGQ